MNLRWIEREGKMVLQTRFEHTANCGQGDYGTGEFSEWADVPTVKEPKKPREFWVEVSEKDEMRAFRRSETTIQFSGKPPDLFRLIKVREVLDDK